MRGSFTLAVAVIAVGVALVGEAGAAPTTDPPANRILAIDAHRTEKARRLAQTYEGALRELNAEIYHCMPWLDVFKEGIGFYKPRHVTADDRYLSLRVFIEQDPSPSFARLPAEQRASAMFSRYVDPLLRRMIRRSDLLQESSLDGFNINLEWIRDARGRDGRPVHEGIAIFLARPLVADYLGGAMAVGDLGDAAYIERWEGETTLGRVRVSAWSDDFVSTYKVKNYQLAPGITCP